jgi:hypothetical protein
MEKPKWLIGPKLAKSVQVKNENYQIEKLEKGS